MPDLGKVAPRYDTKKGRIGNNRIRKLLSSEYYEFSETILIESPFAETTRSGCGIRQVSLALTPSRLIVAADILNAKYEFLCPSNTDPSIENFELISIYPLEYVTLSVFRRRYRKTLKARFINGRISYYELGGTQRKRIIWRIWCEQIQNLHEKKADGSSLSEPTAASSSSSSTLYLFPSEIQIQKGFRGRRKNRILTRYAAAGDRSSAAWLRKDVYLGPFHDELINGQYTPVPVRFAGGSLEEVANELKDYSPNSVANKKPCHSWPTCRSSKQWKTRTNYCDVLFVKEHGFRYCKICTICHGCHSCHFNVNNDKVGRRIARCDSGRYDTLRETRRTPPSRKVSRFGSGVVEKCSSGLVLGPCKGDGDYSKIPQTREERTDPCVLLERAVMLWEGQSKNRKKNQRHFRRYGLSTAAHFLHAVGPWSVQPGERRLLEARRSFSLVTVQRKPLEAELRLPVSRRQLTASVSCDSLRAGNLEDIGSAARSRLVLFWTPEYWYRPRPAAAAYRELREHLKSLKDFQQEKEQCIKRKLFHRRRMRSGTKESRSVAEAKSSGFLGRIFSNSGNSMRRSKEEEQEEDDATIHLRRLLRMNFRITVWDLESETLAVQLTMIDRDLFLRIPSEEIQILVSQKSSKNVPNIGAWIAFSHRISCLTVTEILAVKNLRMRARIVSRFINVANKCFRMGNFQSCRSILAGLQAPPIYRLEATWSFLRIHHASRYEIMEKLCKMYKSPCNSSYRKAWARVERNPPFLPYIGDLVIKVLDFNEPERRNLTEKSRSKNTKPKYQSLTSNTHSIDKDHNNPYQKSNTTLEKKESLAKRILTAAVNKIKFKTNRKICKTEKDIWAASRQQDLARKYFYRWNNIVLRSKIRAREKEESRNLDARKKRILDLTSWLMDSQRHAQEYNFPRHSFAQEFLLRARYKEDRENFFISLKLEPPKVT